MFQRNVGSLGDRQQTREELTAGLEARAKQIEFRLEGNKCLLCCGKPTAQLAHHGRLFRGLWPTTHR